MAKHMVRPFVSRISEVEDIRPRIVDLDELLPASGTTPIARRGDIRPLFQLPEVPFDMDHPEVQASIEQARVLAAGQVHEANQRELKVLADRYAEAFMRLEQSILGIERVVASEVVDLALVVARELVQAELGQRPDRLVEIVEQALAQVPHEGTVSVRMHPLDIAAVTERAEFQTNGGGVEWVADEALARGDCIVATPEKMIDASIDARLSSVRGSLVRALMVEEGQKGGRR